jgi:hypothetical protein
MKRILAFFMMFLMVVVPVMAQVNASYSGLDHINRIIAGTPGITTNGISTGLQATAAGDVLVNPSGLKIPIPVSITANIAKSAIASAALGCATGVLAAVGCASTAAAVLTELKNAGLGYGPCPVGSINPYAFICRPDPNTNTTIVPTDSSPWENTSTLATGTISALASPLYSQYGCTSNQRVVYNGNNSANVKCTNQYGDVGLANLIWIGGGTYSVPLGPMIEATQTQMNTDLQTRMNQDYAANQRLMNAMRADQAVNSDLWPNSKLVPDTTPVTVTAPAVTTPQTVTGTRTIAQADGSTNTETTKQQTTVTPTTTGSTVSDSKTTFPSVTTTTVSTVNNVSNVTTTNTTVTTTATPDVVQPQIKIPTDYARQGTLEQVEKDVNTDSATAMPDQTAIATAAKTKSDSDLQNLQTAAQNGVTADKSSIFSWVWSPPVGTCSFPSATLRSGAVINWDPCPTFNDFRDVINWLFALYGAIEIYGQIFRKGEV